MNYDKPFKTFTEQIAYLSDNYHLLISDKEFANTALQTIPYYDLVNGYKDSMMIGNQFKASITIEFLYTFYLFDKGFQNIIFKQIMFLENKFKLLLSYTISKNFGVHQDDYLSEKNYLSCKNNLKFKKLKTNIEKIYIPKNIYDIPQPTRHYVSTHNHIPAWILFKNISFSNAINLFALLEPNEKSEIINAMIPDNILYKEKAEFLLRSLNLLRKFRNQIAHNLKFVTYKSPKADTLSAKTLKKLLPNQLISWNDINKQSRGLNDIYANMLLIICLLKDKYLITTFCNEIFSFIYPLDATLNEQMKASMFKEYATITNLPYNLPDRIISYRKNVLSKR